MNLEFSCVMKSLGSESRLESTADLGFWAVESLAISFQMIRSYDARLVWPPF
jgi:hypothetical protein